MCLMDGSKIWDYATNRDVLLRPDTCSLVRRRLEVDGGRAVIGISRADHFRPYLYLRTLVPRTRKLSWDSMLIEFN